MTYRLSQVEGALHALMSGRGSTGHRRVGERPSLTFRNQIKRLLEVDRGRLRKQPGIKPAFFDVLPDGSGSDASYDEFGTFCLAIALEMMSYGFKQGEVVEKTASMRLSLLKFHKKISATLKSEGPTYWTTRNEGDPDVRRVFLVIDQLDIPRPGRGESVIGPSEEWTPAIQRGWKRLQDRLNHLLKRGARSVFIVELSEIAVRINEFLPQQPLHRRGRS